MTRTATESVIEIWKAGLDAVRSDDAVFESIKIANGSLTIADDAVPLSDIDRVCVVGAGKAGAGMTAGLLRAISPLDLGDRLSGWVNVPEGSAELFANASDSPVQLHSARPAGVNEPTARGVEGTRQIVRLVESLGPNDLCVCVLSGGGSALLPLPTDDITLKEKVQLTKDLSAAGATIQQLNAVRRRYSQIKAGGLARRCNAGRLITLIVSDVIGDPLDVIASGPTVVEQMTEVSLSPLLQPLTEAGATRSLELVRLVIDHPAPATSQDCSPKSLRCTVRNHIIANNQIAVEAAAKQARELGFRCEILPSESADTTADELGVRLAQRLMTESQKPRGSICFISGGEPVVRLAAEAKRGKGGRNQQLVLAALQALQGATMSHDFAVLSAGTDGEDGPTDCAGAFCNSGVLRAATNLRLDISDYLTRNDAFHFFEQAGGLFRTGPTNTNVCDVRVIAISC